MENQDPPPSTESEATVQIKMVFIKSRKLACCSISKNNISNYVGRVRQKAVTRSFIKLPYEAETRKEKSYID